MNNLTQYQLFAHLAEPGDLVLFWGKGIISGLIRFFAGGGPSHCALVGQAMHQHYPDVQLFESTVGDGYKDGVQRTMLRERVANYDRGGAMALVKLRASYRRKIDLAKFYSFMGDCEDRVKYGEGDLLEFLAREVPIAGDYVFQDEHKATMVCSACAGALWTVSGLLHGCNWTKMRPQDLAEIGQYESTIYPLLGQPPQIKRFNTLY